MRKLTSLLIVVLLVLTGIYALPVSGEQGDEPDDIEMENSAPRGTRGTLYVGSGQTYTKIQDAVDAAISGDTIRVYAGTYYENVVIDKTISLIGNGTSHTVVNGSFTGSTITIKANWCNVSGLYVTGSGKGSEDSGIKLLGVENCRIDYSNCSENEIGIFLKNSKSLYINRESWF